MSFTIFRVVNGRREYIGHDSHGRDQYTNNYPSRHKYDSLVAAMRAAWGLVLGVIGALVVEDEETGEQRRVFAPWDSGRAIDVDAARTNDRGRA